METIFLEVEHALDARLYYLALVMALTIPEICAALESPTGDTSGRNAQAYKDWYDANLAAHIPQLTDIDCYSLRCGVVHQGQFGHKNMQYARAAFALPEAPSINGCVAGDIYLHSVVDFCRTVVLAARAWFAAHQNDANVQTNLPRLVQYRPNGMPPAFIGIPVIS
jgi:hypothetical protein